ncbi:ATP-grasp domain-containing protein [Planctomicrobium piriforme]|uniref:Predicted ATP-dependent carboligase, ATP-grasp superfamily n=1 Tax=Planctomicrobium piriforme TaxID=1576369 RepID=A0A1I3NLE9_9PLAN|nr:ATP-grasp domain-containing protein [Planctomicrobium piriforme]SFJ10015.1 Predicted ATP-dependent carboligase, ATP-grasp superfamily [Planctomicrobium piriforme]
MQIFVSEFVCGGDWPDFKVPTSLLTEGRAMLLAVVTDLTQLPGVTVITTWDQCLRYARPTFPKGVQVYEVSSPTQTREVSLGLAAQSDRTLVIAPEFDDLLAARCELLRSNGARLLNCSTEAIRLATDKLAVYEMCVRAGIPTIETQLMGETRPWPRCVVKRRDGAGSLDMRLVSSDVWWDIMRRRADPIEFIVQPYVSARALSVTAVVDNGQLRCLFPVGGQRLSDDGLFQYLGGAIPADVSRLSPFAEMPSIEATSNSAPHSRPLSPEDRGEGGWTAATELVSRVVGEIPGLHGLVGFDLLAPDDQPGDLVLVEINPRLTTSYVGYRTLSTENLAALLLNPAEAPLPEFRGSVTFTPDGQLEWQP